MASINCTFFGYYYPITVILIFTITHLFVFWICYGKFHPTSIHEKQTENSACVRQEKSYGGPINFRLLIFTLQSRYAICSHWSKKTLACKIINGTVQKPRVCQNNRQFKLYFIILCIFKEI